MSDQIKGMWAGMWQAQKRIGSIQYFGCKNLEGRDHLEDLGIDEKLI
jgi:hypothetical protein